MDDEKEYEGDVVEDDDEDYEDDDTFDEEEAAATAAPSRAAPQPSSSSSNSSSSSGKNASSNGNDNGVAGARYEDEDEDEDEEEEEEEDEAGADLVAPLGDDDVDAAAADADGSEQAVSVIVRVRPLLDDEAQPVVGPDGVTLVPAPAPAVRLVEDGLSNKVRVEQAGQPHREGFLECGYDRVLGPGSAQRDVFDSTAIRPAVLGVARGVSCCVFAYGQTSAGKTYTMLGNDAVGRGGLAASAAVNRDEAAQHGGE